MLYWSSSTGHWKVTQWAREKQQKGSGSPSRVTEVSLLECMPVLSCSGIIWMTFPMGVLFLLHIYPKSGEWLSSNPVSMG